MDILYYSYYFPNRYILNEIRGLERRGHSVAVFSLRDGSTEHAPEELDEIDATIHVYQDAARTSLSGFLNRRTFGLERVMLDTYPFLTSPTAHARCVFHAGRCIEFIDRLDLEVDLVHVHVPSQKTAAAPLVASHFDVPWTVTVHSLSEYHRTGREWSVAMCHDCDRIAAISEVVRNELSQLGVETPMDIVRMGVDPKKFSPTAIEVPGKIVTVSRLSETKGLETAIEAIDRLRERYEWIQYTIIGSGKLEGVLREQIQDRGLGSTVELTGFLTGDELLHHLDEASVFLLPCVIAKAGNRDGIPVSLMEAMAMETPCVTTSVGGIPELISNETEGLIVEPGDVSATQDAIASLLDDDSRRKHIGRAARRAVLREFTTEQQLESLTEVFRSAIGTTPNSVTVQYSS